MEIRLSDEEINNILECLIFSISVDVSAEWDEDIHAKEILDIMYRLTSFDNALRKMPNIYLSKNAILDNKKLVKEIKQHVRIKSK